MEAGLENSVLVARVGTARCWAFISGIWMVEVSTVNAGNPQPEQEGADLSEEASETTHQFFWK